VRNRKCPSSIGHATKGLQNCFIIFGLLLKVIRAIKCSPDMKAIRISMMGLRLPLLSRRDNRLLILAEATEVLW
jgi:hypothetical protein